MKRIIILPVLLVLFPGLLICQTENYFTGFRIPKTSATNLILSWDINLTRNLKTFSGGSEQRNARWSSSVIPIIFFDYFFESEQTQLALYSDSRNRWQYLTTKIHHFDGNKEDRKSTFWETSNFVNFSVNWFPTSFPASFYLNGATLTGYSDNKLEIKGSPSTRGRRFKVDIASPAGLSVGRVRNATVIFWAIRVFERLDEIGLLTRQPSGEDIHRLAKLLYKLREYRTNYERYEKYFMPGVMEFLRNRNYINVPELEVTAALKVFEVFSERVFTRQRGWRLFAGYGPQGEYLWEKERNPENAAETGNSTKTTRLHNIFGLLEGGGNIYLPLTNRLQLDGVVSGAFSNQELPKRYTWTNILRLSYEINERWDVSLSTGFMQSHEMKSGFSNLIFRRAITPLTRGAFQQFFFPEVFFESFLRNEPLLTPSTTIRSEKMAPVNISIRYFIEDRVTLNLGAHLIYQENRYAFRRRNSTDINHSSKSDSRDWQIVVGVFYNII